MFSVLAGLNLVLACLLAWLWIDPHGGLRNMHWEPPAAIKPDLGSTPAASIGKEDADTSRFMVIVDRPVFNTSRRPAPSLAKGSAPSRPDPLDSIHLYGLFSGSSGGGAIVQVEGKTRRVKLSEMIGDWSLKEIRPREAVFARGPESRVVPLTQAKQSTAAVANRGPAGYPLAGFPGYPGFPMPNAPAVVAPPMAPSAQNSTPVAPPAQAVAAPPAPAAPTAAAAAKPSGATATPGASSGAANPFVTGATR